MSLYRDHSVQKTMRRLLSVLLLFAFLAFFLPGSAHAGQEARYPVTPVYPPPLERPPVRPRPEDLPQGSRGAYPAYDGEPFHVNLPQKLAIEPDEKSVREVIDRILPALGWERAPLELVFVTAASLPAANSGYVEQALKAGLQRMTQRLEQKFGTVSLSTQQALQEYAEQYRAIALHEQRLFTYDQRFEELRVEYARVIGRWQGGDGLVAVSGRVFDRVTLENKPRLDGGQAIEVAWKYIEQTSKPLDEPKPEPELVVYPYRAFFRYAWRLEVGTPEGVYRLWLDAESGEVLELLPQFFSDSAQGLTFDPSPDGATEVISFEVNSAAGGNYQLIETGTLDVNNRGADGVTNTDLSIGAGTSGSANFNVSPFTGTVVSCITTANYNSRFQEVNAYALVYHDIYLFKLLGSQQFGAMRVDVNDSVVGGWGIDNSCSGGTYLAFGLGSATQLCSNAAARMFNGALDATVVAHELGHTLNGLQFAAGGGTLHGSLNEGVADFWGSTLYDTDTFGAYWGRNRGAPVQDGHVPRQAEARDVFPEHRSIGGAAGSGANAEIHADGQMFNWALWSSRTGLNNLGPLGTLLIDITLLKAENGAGVGVSSSTNDSGVHQAFLNLLQQLAGEFEGYTTLHKVLSGFARAGITLAERDAIVDINDDWLANSAATGPTFTIFTGRDFQISGSNAVAANVFNTDYEVEVANDANFSVNRVTSGNQTNVAVSAEGVPRGIWTLPTADWNTLKTGTRLYYRVTTRDHSGGNVRTSANPGNGFFEGTPPAYAVINATGQYTGPCGPTTGASPGQRAMGALVLLPMAVAFVWRRRSR